jgi:hypothetical protein
MTLQRMCTSLTDTHIFAVCYVVNIVCWKPKTKAAGSSSTGTPIKTTFAKFGQKFQNWTELHEGHTQTGDINLLSSLTEFKLGYKPKTCPEERRWMKLSYTCPTAGFILAVLKVGFMFLRGGADKSSARPTSRCRRTELIVSLERGVCSCTELKVSPCYRGRKEACQATRAISTTSRRKLSNFIFLQGKTPKEIRAILKETLRKHAPSYANVKNWMAV